jgi:hypothetical protein
MNNSKRKLALGLLLAAGSYPVLAQLGGLGGLIGGLMGGGAKSSGADPKKLESDLKLIIGSTSVALAKLADAMGLKESSAKMQKNADDIKSGAVGLSDSTTTVSDTCASVVAEIAKNQQSGKKLDAASSAIALEAIEPGIKSFPLWKSVAEGVKSLDRSSMMGAVALVEAAPKIPTAAKNSLDLYQAGISYLAFSGADTSSVKTAAESALKF